MRFAPKRSGDQRPAMKGFETNHQQNERADGEVSGDQRPAMKGFETKRVCPTSWSASVVEISAPL